MRTNNKRATITLIILSAISLIFNIVFASVFSIKYDTPYSVIENYLNAAISSILLIFFISDLLLTGKRTSAKNFTIIILCALSLAVSAVTADFIVWLGGDKYRVKSFLIILLSIISIVQLAVSCLKDFKTQRNKNPIIIALSALPFIISVIITVFVYNTYHIRDFLLSCSVLVITIIPIVDSIIWVVKRKKLSE